VPAVDFGFSISAVASSLVVTTLVVTTPTGFETEQALRLYGVNDGFSEARGLVLFRVIIGCADVGPKTCYWQVSGNSEQEIMPKIEQHGREKHNLTMDDETRNRVRRAIQRKAA
jgi:predicted small metal-binding protein